MNVGTLIWRYAMINGWPQRGDTVLWTAGPHPLLLRVADSLIVEAGAFAYLKAYPADSHHQGTYFVRPTDITTPSTRAKAPAGPRHPAP